jgi:hypothetical protein
MGTGAVLGMVLIATVIFILSVHMHGIPLLPVGRFSWNLIVEYALKTYWKKFQV